MAESRIDDLRRRVAEDPGSRLFAQLAEEHRRAGEHAEAVRVARAGLAVHPVYASARLTLGRALLDSGDAASARAELEEAFRQAPESILAARLLAEALEAAGDLEAALRQYGAAVRLAPGDAELQARREAVEARLRARAEAAPAPPTLASPTLAELYLRQGVAERAIEVYRQVVAENPDNDRARARLEEIVALVSSRGGEQAVAMRRKLERTIDRLEALLGASRRR